MAKRKRTACLLVLLASSTNIGSSQEKPSSVDSMAYKEAYELLFDSQSRARKALNILLKDGSLSPLELNDRELSLLCSIYNELGDAKRQLEVASVLWNRDPRSKVAMYLMSDSLLFKLSSDAGVEEVMVFVEEAIKKNHGIRRSLLILKANAVLAKKSIPDAQKRLEVTDLLVEAYACDPSPKGELNFSAGEVTNFIIDEYSFATFFSESERRTIKARMLRARKDIESQRQKE